MGEIKYAPVNYNKVYEENNNSKMCSLYASSSEI